MVVETIPPNAIVVDVRTPEECSVGMYPNAVNIPIQQLSSRLNELGEKNRPIILYCVSGARSALAAKILRSFGFENVHDGGGLSQLPH